MLLGQSLTHGNRRGLSSIESCVVFVDYLSLHSNVAAYIFLTTSARMREGYGSCLVCVCLSVCVCIIFYTNRHVKYQTLSEPKTIVLFT